MLTSSLPRPTPLYSRPDIALSHHGVRSARTRIMWLVILSHTPWDTLSRPTWASNVTLEHETGMDDRAVRRAIASLQSAGMVKLSNGIRPGARRAFGRIFDPALTSPVQVIVPERDGVARLWALARSRRTRCAPLVLAGLGAHVLSCHHARRRLTAAGEIGCSQGDWRRLIGATKGSQWSRIVADLEHLELIQRRDSGVWVMPPSTWSPARLAMRDAPRKRARLDEPDLPPIPPPEEPPWWGCERVCA